MDNSNLTIYSVGGAVRDQCLGLAIKDRDWVVVGSTPEAMLALGFKSVGKSFPVFLHPRTHEEYALARTEKKTGLGHTAFECHAAPDVTLEEDLLRRDLTINAMAMDQNGAIIDPYGGLADLNAGILRHVSPAFRDDPLRVLRIARFAARFNFDVATETMQLLQEMCASGELEHISRERIWKEWTQGLLAPYPHRMLEVLYTCGALQWVWPRLNQAWNTPYHASTTNYGEWFSQHLIEFAQLHKQQDDTEKLNAITTLFLIGLEQFQPNQALNAYQEEAQWARWTKALIQFQHHTLQTLRFLASEKSAEHYVKCFEQLDGMRRPELSEQVFKHLHHFVYVLPEYRHWMDALEKLTLVFEQLRTITPHAWIGEIPPQAIPARLYEERLKKVQQRINSNWNKR